MEKTVVIIGLGQLGRVFAGSFLRAGHTAVPVNRGDDMAAIAARHPAPELVLVAVAESDLHVVLAALPSVWKSRAGLLQNELLPRDWQRHGINDPTVCVVWFEKKKGVDANALIASPAFGPAADAMLCGLSAVDLPARPLGSADDLLFELVRKNLFILTTNIAGLKVGGTTGELWAKHRDLARTVANEVLDIQEWLAERTFDREELIAGMVEAIAAKPDHACTGRSAQARLARNLGYADEAELAVQTLREIQAASVQR